MPELMIEGLQFRPIEARDEALLAAIYASTRAEEMAMVTDWPEEQKQAFLQQQFQAQHTYYQQVYPQGLFLVIVADGQPAGRLYLDYRPQELRIVDVALLPDFRGRSLGEKILRGLLAEAAVAGNSVTIHVERMNRALHLYERLGFEVLSEENQVYLLMRWQPEPG